MKAYAVYLNVKRKYELILSKCITVHVCLTAKPSTVKPLKIQ